MRIDFADLVAPAHTAVLTMEFQRGVVGDLATIDVLRDQVEAAGVTDNVVGLCAAARAAGAAVVHCTAQFRSNLVGSAANNRMLSFSLKSNGELMAEGAAGAELVPALGPEDGDVVMPRYHGLTPFTSTSLDQTLRNMGISTVVASGVSVNIGVLGMVISASDLGYQVVVPRDAVAGVPADYADLVIDNTVANLATVTTTADLLAAWS